MSALRLFLPAAAALLLAATPASGQLDFGKLTKGLDKLKQGLDTAKDASKVAKAATGIGPVEERNIGDAVALEIIAKYGGIERDPDIMRHVNLVGRALAQYSDRPELEWRFAVLASDTINAFSAPGGYVFITRGLYERVDSDDVLAGILGHEIAHITKRHALKIVERNEAAAGGKNLLLKRSSDARELDAKVKEANAELGVDLGALAKQIIETGFDAPTEYEADREGRLLAVTNGFAPGGLRAVLLGLRQGGENRKTMFSTHPPLDARIQRLPDEPAPPATPPPPRALPEKFAGDGDPRVLASVNGQVLHLLTPSGETEWRRHAEGEILICSLGEDFPVEFREGPVTLNPGEMIVIPRRREYRFPSTAETRVLILAPAGLDLD